ncbi:MAG TPA: hypothetical protein VEQ11_19495 [Chloroflexota bacterium]|nr:hypothetical protein [Chloroflexota bacterium]
MVAGILSLLFLLALVAGTWGHRSHGNASWLPFVLLVLITLGLLLTGNLSV